MAFVVLPVTNFIFLSPSYLFSRGALLNRKRPGVYNYTLRDGIHTHDFRGTTRVAPPTRDLFRAPVTWGERAALHHTLFGGSDCRLRSVALPRLSGAGFQSVTRVLCRTPRGAVFVDAFEILICCGTFYAVFFNLSMIFLKQVKSHKGKVKFS